MELRRDYGCRTLASSCYIGYYYFAFWRQKIPELAKGLGKGIKSFKNELESSDEAKAEIKDDKPKSSEAVNKEQKEA